MTELVDLHCHILPAIDDGAQSIEMSAALLEASARSGVTRFVFTPHYIPNRMRPEGFLGNRDAAFQEVRALEAFSALEMRCGAEIAYVPFFDRLPLENLTLGDSRYLLIELNTRYLEPGVEDMLRAVRARGLVPVLAHVERYVYLREDPTLLYRWVLLGALAQVNARMALKSPADRRALLQLADWGLVHLMASDTHHIERRPPLLAEGYEKLPAALAAQLQENAAAVFDDRVIEPRKPKCPTRHFGGWK